MTTSSAKTKGSPGAGPHRSSTRIAGLFRGAWRELAVPLEKRNPFLDGLRAIAILLVINAHQAAAFAVQFGKNTYNRFPLTSDGWMGVDLFFVLSGFFIGSQLWRELSETGTISFGRFMLRRGLRIWPLYFFVFAAVSIIFVPAALFPRYGWSDIVFLSNYFRHGIVGGSWSLSSEEQFYILAPLSLLLFAKRSAGAYRWGLLGLLVAELGIRMAIFYHLTGHLFVRNPNAMKVMYFPFHTHCDGLIAGMLIANLVAYTDPIKAKNLPWLAIAAGLLMLLAVFVFHFESLNFCALAVFFGGIVWLSTQRVIPIFNAHIFYVLSRLSYGMYLNHQYMGSWVVKHVSPVLLRLPFGHAGATALSSLTLVCMSTALSALTFALIEHPFLVLRTALLQRKAIPLLVAR